MYSAMPPSCPNFLLSFSYWEKNFMLTPPSLFELYPPSKYFSELGYFTQFDNIWLFFAFFFFSGLHFIYLAFQGQLCVHSCMPMFVLNYVGFLLLNGILSHDSYFYYLDSERLLGRRAWKLGCSRENGKLWRKDWCEVINKEWEQGIDDYAWLLTCLATVITDEVGRLL